MSPQEGWLSHCPWLEADRERRTHGASENDRAWMADCGRLHHIADTGRFVGPPVRNIAQSALGRALAFAEGSSWARRPGPAWRRRLLDATAVAGNEVLANVLGDVLDLPPGAVTEDT